MFGEKTHSYIRLLSILRIYHLFYIHILSLLSLFPLLILCILSKSRSFVFIFVYAYLIIYDNYSISADLSSNRSSFACLRLFLFSLWNVLYSLSHFGIVCCLFFIRSIIFFFFQPFLPCLLFLGRILFADISIFSLNVSHHEFPLSFRSLHFLLTLSAYNSLQFESFRICVVLWLLLNFSRFILRFHITGKCININIHKNNSCRYSRIINILKHLVAHR